MVAANPSIRVGSILSGTFATFGANATPAAIYLLVFGGGGIVGQYVSTLGSQDYEIAGIVIQFTFIIFAIFGGYLLTEVMLKRAGLFHNDDARHFLSYFGQGILIGLGAMLGFVLLIVPGIILVARWSLASSFLIGKGTGAVDGIQESWRATSGYTGTIVLAAIPLGLLFLVAMGAAAASAATVATGGAEGLVGIVIENLASQLFSIVSIAFSVTLFGLIADPSGRVTEVFA